MNIKALRVKTECRWLQQAHSKLILRFANTRVPFTGFKTNNDITSNIILMNAQGDFLLQEYPV
jgi:hypothetical protein